MTSMAKLQSWTKRNHVDTDSQLTGQATNILCSYSHHCRDTTKSYVKADIRDISAEAFASSPEKFLTNTTME